MVKVKSKLKIKTTTFLNVSAVILVIYAYSRSSWGNFIPYLVWQVLLLIATTLMLVYLMKKRRIKGNFAYLLFIIMFLFFSVNNHDVDVNGWFSTVDLWLYLLFEFVVLSQEISWTRATIKIITALSMCYAILTMFCYANQSFYYDIVYPAMSEYVTVAWFTAHPSAGFTTDYSVNACYIAVGICATLIYVIGRKYIQNKVGALCVIIALLGSLMAGKRAIILALVVAFLVAYINVTCNIKRNRYTKLIFGIAGVSALIVALSPFVPSINYVFERFAEKSAAGDVTSGRILYWIYAWQNFLEKPFLGHGWSWFAYNNPVDNAINVHNTFLQLLLETGIVGTAVFFTFFIREIILIFKISRLVVKNNVLFMPDDIVNIYFSLTFQIYYMLIIEMGAGFYSTTQLITYFMCCAITEYYSRTLQVHVFGKEQII